MRERESVMVWAPRESLERMRILTDQGKEARKKIENAPRWERRSARDVPAAERAAIRVELAEHLSVLRRSGRLLDTQVAVVEYGARAALAARGWDRDWPAPPEEARLAGRWAGSQDVGAPEKIVVRADAALVEQVRAACWWNSAESIAGVRAWRDAHPGLVFERTDIREYERLAAGVTTVGELWREGLELVLPPLPPKPDPW